MPAELTIAVGFYVVFLLSVSLHEAGHAWAALRLGDNTAYLGGQVSFDSFEGAGTTFRIQLPPQPAGETSI